jgi:septal ring factor EnvC (AmiA/AmiB activator)
LDWCSPPSRTSTPACTGSTSRPRPIYHAGRVLTLYAALSSCQVNKDETVTLGQVVGQASDKLYFEIRVENRPEDPVHWLR